MKKITSLISLLLLAVISAYAQKFPQEELYSLNGFHLEIPPCNKIKIRNNDFVLDSMIGYSLANSIWKKDSKNYFSYNKNFQLIRDSMAIWSEITIPGWYPGSMNLYTYINSDKVNTLKKLTWSELNNTWRNDTVMVTNYYSGKQLIKVTQGYYNSDSIKYVSGTTDSLKYDKNGVLTHRIIYIPDGNKLAPLGRIFYKYDNGNLSSWLLQVSLDKGLNWKNYSRQFLHYQGSLLDNAVTEFYNEFTSNFDSYSTEEFEYDPNELLVNRNLFFWDEKSWVLENSFDYYYSKKIVTAYNPEPQPYTSNIIMANPFKGGNIIIDSDSINNSYHIEILNNTQQVVYNSTLNGKVLNLPPLKDNGFYIIRVTQGGNLIGTRKFISMH